MRRFESYRGHQSPSWGDAFAHTCIHVHSVATRRRWFLQPALIVLLVVGGCGTDDGDNATAASPSESPTLSLEGPTWALSSALATDSPLEDIVVTARFQQGTLSGESGCNTYSTSYEVNGTSLTIASEIAGTRRACPPAETAVERAYLQRLPEVSAYRISSGTLTLLDGDGEKLLEYAATIGAEAILGEWIVTSYLSGDAITSVLGGVEMTTTFAPLEVTGSAGCNRFNGPYEVDGDAITIGPLASTKAACPTDELQQQETDYLAALGLATTFRVSGNRLDLLRTGDTIAATLTRA